MLLHRGPSKKKEGVEADGADDADDANKEDNSGNKQSFRSDRRIARLIIARFWADQLIAKYKTYTKDVV